MEAWLRVSLQANDKEHQAEIARHNDIPECQGDIRYHRLLFSAENIENIAENHRVVITQYSQNRHWRQTRLLSCQIINSAHCKTTDGKIEKSIPQE
ncbi:hypothetical protein Mapa_005464 [Marchantia paleacea]|nr:hypothetical protein Mapa_005464 [Marchantia paleacea]